MNPGNRIMCHGANCCGVVYLPREMRGATKAS